MKGALYSNKVNGKVALCLGFRAWGALGIPMVLHSIEEKAGCLQEGTGGRFNNLLEVDTCL